MEEIVALTWDRVRGDRLCLECREVPLSGGAKKVLEDLAKQEGREGYVLTAPRSGLPYDRTRLSKLVRAALIRAGLDDLTLRDLRVDCALRSGGEGQILSQARRRGIDVSQCRPLLQRLLAQGRILQQRQRYIAIHIK